MIIAVKGYDLAQALKDIKYQVGPETIILPVLNGIDSEKQTADVYGQEHVLYSYMRVSIAMKDGKAEFDPEKGLIHFGEEKNDPSHLSDKVLAVKELFDRCGIDYKIDPDMIKGLWFKFMCNVGENMTCAMFGIPFGAFQKSADANYFRRAAMWEVIRVANRLGVDIGQNEIDRQEHTIGRLPYQNKPSTLRIWRPESTQKWTCLQAQWSAWKRAGSGNARLRNVLARDPSDRGPDLRKHLISLSPARFPIPLPEPENRRGRVFIFYGQRALARAAAPSRIFSSVRLAYPRITVRLSVSFFPI